MSLARTYVNFLVSHRRRLFPLLDPLIRPRGAADAGADFPGDQVVGVAVREVLLGGGNILYITQQIPG